MTSFAMVNSPCTGPLTVDAIFPFYDFASPDEDPEIDESNRHRKRAMCEHTISRINRVLSLILDHWSNASPLQIYVGFTMSCGAVDELLLSITDRQFLSAVDAEVHSRDEQLHPRRRRPVPPPRVSEPDFDDESTQKPVKRIRSLKYSKPPDLPCPTEVQASDWAQWSDAHKRSYLTGTAEGSAKRNSYLYRNLPQGETQRSGPWTDAEKRHFLERLAEMRPNWADSGPQWGLFSETIPGRVGYQCANFYRALVAAGEVADPDYEIGEDGKLHYIRKRQHPGGKEPKQLSFYERKAKKNPLPGQIDFITKNEIQVPTMSPDGYILDYKTWMNIVVQPNPEDPFTRTRINKRRLVVLTKKNIEQYRAQIKNLGEETGEE
jgi:hypothetical protein